MCLVVLMAQDDDPATVVASARSALAAGAPERLVLAAGSDDAARARLARLAAAVQAGRFDLKPREHRVHDDCAAVVVEGSRPRNGRPDIFGLYLVREEGAWRLLSDPTRPQATDPARTARLAALATWVAERASLEPVVLAGDALATWMLGNATVAERPVRPGAAIGLGQRIVLAPGKPGRLVLNRLEGSSISCAPGTALTMVEEPVDAGTDLVIDLEAGAVQVDVLARGPYAHVRVRGLVSDVTVVGTIFLVQRVAKDHDYVVQVEGSVRVRPKTGDATVELTGRQGVTVGLVGLDPVDLLLTRPQLVPERLAQGDLRRQGLTPDPGGGGWDKDPIRDQSPRMVTAEEQAEAQVAAASMSETDDAAPPAALGGGAAASKAAVSSTSRSASPATNQIGIANPGLGGERGTGALTISPAAATGGSSGGSAGGVSQGAATAPLSGHPGFPTP
ncbi:MAG TPA: hypothetical protein DCS97_02360 [Planctomycetes bacterium]|nr:hypothetical protein [Planctomycetota bacterium]